MASDYKLVRADEAFLAELPWPQHTGRDAFQGTSRADVEHQWFRAVSPHSSGDATMSSATSRRS
jgi:hypothetical protein